MPALASIPTSRCQRQRDDGRAQPRMEVDTGDFMGIRRRVPAWMLMLRRSDASVRDGFDGAGVGGGGGVLTGI